MPGKVHPVIPEVVNQMCFQNSGSDAVISMAAEACELAGTWPNLAGVAATVGHFDM
jgi:aspartate ammonia-lyase